MYGPTIIPRGNLHPRWNISFARPVNVHGDSPWNNQSRIITTPTASTADNFSFNPGVAAVRAGTELTWENHDDIPHNVVSIDQSFRSPILDTGEKFTHRFGTRGEYNYYCSLHPKMTGKLVVN